MGASLRRCGAAAILLSAATLGDASAQAQPDDAAGRITLVVGRPIPGPAFSCRLPVRVHHPDSLHLRRLTVIAEAQGEEGKLSSTGIDTGERPLVRDREDGVVQYQVAPVQFDLTEDICDEMNRLAIVFARCTFGNGETVPCADRLRFEPKTVSGVDLVVGEDAPAQ